MTFFRGNIPVLFFYIGGNVLLFVLTGAFIAAVGEIWLRLQWPFVRSSLPMHFVPKVGWMIQPNTEVRWTNYFDFWTVSRTNSEGFLDREPIAPERAAASCHIALIGDSFVAAREVPIADKSHIRLEALAARALPALDVTTAAFGIGNTGQLNQLPLYDEFARRRRPKLVVLVFVLNDFKDNASVLKSLPNRWDPDRMPWVSARRDPDGRMRLLPPDPDGRCRVPYPNAWPLVPHLKTNSLSYLLVMKYRLRRVFPRSYFAHWLDIKLKFKLIKFDLVEELRTRPGYEALLGDWRPKPGPKYGRDQVNQMFNEKDLPPFFEAALDFTAFGLDQFKERADRDGVPLVILSTHTMRVRGDWRFNRLHALATARGIPVIDQYDYIRRQGAEVRDAYWRHDPHWNAAGHQWAAEALLEYLKRNPAICAQQPDLLGRSP